MFLFNSLGVLVIEMVLISDLFDSLFWNIMME